MFHCFRESPQFSYRRIVSRSEHCRGFIGIRGRVQFLGILCLALLLVGCGGNSSTSTPEPPSEPGGPIVNPEGGDDIGTPSLVAGDAAVSASITRDASQVYSVPAGSQITLSSISGNADLYLSASESFAEENILCSARSSWIDDICSDQNARYAMVYAREDTQYQISATYDCSVQPQNRWVDRQMRDYYLFYDQVPSLNLGDYDSPESLIRDLRFTERDPFSSVRDAAQLDQLFDEGTSFGMGYRVVRDAEGLPRIARVYDDSPMGRANVKRSDIIVSINNVPWDELDSSRYNELVGTRDNPLPTTWVFRDSETNETRQVALTQSLYRVNTVLHRQIITHPEYSGRIGYLVFDRFLGTSAAELDSAIDFFQSNKVTDLILDVRYNSGGLTSIARKLMSQISGPATDDQLLISYRNNDKYENLNFERFFRSESTALGLDRLVVVTTGTTASSSEIVINSLRPYIDVVTVGSATSGKPYISFARDFCGKSVSAMSAEGVNANGVGVFGGIAADCAAADDLTRDFGVNNGSVEGMIKSAAEHIVFGSCDAVTLTKRAADNVVDKEVFDPENIDLPESIGY